MVSMTLATVGGKATASIPNGIETYVTPMGSAVILPTSVAVGAGSRTISTLGRINLTAATTIDIRGIFNQGYAAVSCYFEGVFSGAAYWTAQFTVGGTPNTSGYSYSVMATTTAAAFSASGAVANWQVQQAASGAGMTASGEMKFFGVGTSAACVMSQVGGVVTTTSAVTGGHVQGQHTSTVARDGIFLTPVTGTFTGVMWFTGINNG